MKTKYVKDKLRLSKHRFKALRLVNEFIDNRSTPKAVRFRAIRERDRLLNLICFGSDLARMDPLTQEQNEYLELKIIESRINRVWIKFGREIEGCHPFKQRLHNETGITRNWQSMFYNYIELMKNPEIVKIMEKMLDEKFTK